MINQLKNIKKEKKKRERDTNSVPGLRRSPGGVNGIPYSCLENPVERGASWATVHRVTKNWT